MGVSRQNLDQIRNALNPLDIIREAVPSLKQAGNRWRGLCPFHNERTGSFFFMPEKGLWHCFGSCQEGGDIFKFVMRLENIPFPEALRQLAQRAGVKLEYDRGSEPSSKEQQEKDRLLDLLTEAAAFYHEALKTAADAEPARRHLARRRIKPETIDAFQLGYSSRAPNGFLDAALKKGRPIEDLMRAGLAVRSEKTGRYHDPVHDRLVFPIVDPYGRVVGFGGRVLDEEGEGDAKSAGPKYLNSPETPVYTKSRQLYGLYQNRNGLREKGQALLVEGYMDVIGLHQGGFDNAVAPLGTAFTKEQGQLLKRYAQEVILLFDPDAAGTRASWRSAEVLLPADLFVRVARVPGGKDPDELILEKGAGALHETIRAAQDMVDFWLEEIAASAGRRFEGLHERVRQAQELLNAMKGVPNELLRREWVKKIAKKLSLDEGSLWRELQKGVPVVPGGRPPAAAPVSPARPAAPERRAMSVRSLEEEILQLFCNHPEVGPHLGSLPPALFHDPRCQRVVDRLREQWAAAGKVDVAGLFGGLPPEDAGWLSALMVEEKTFESPQETIARRLHRLEVLAFERERLALQKEVLPMVEGRAPRDEAKVSRYQELTRFLSGTVRAEAKTI